MLGTAFALFVYYVISNNSSKLMRVLRCHYPRITNRFLVYRLAGTFNMSRLYFLVLVFLLENSRENSNCEKRCHYWRNAMTKYTSEHYQRLFQHHAAHGGRLAKKELTSSEYRAFRRLFDGNTGLTAPFGYPENSEL